MVIIALALPALMGFAGLAIDGSRAFDERRQMQNAADASALAGARKFNDWLMNPEKTSGAGTQASEVDEVVRAVAAENGADPALVQCSWMANGNATWAGAELGPCSVTYHATNASGVRVRTSASRKTVFIRAVGKDNFTASAQATAQVQRLTQFGQGVPFLVCSDYHSEVDGSGVEVETAAPDLLDQDAAGVWSIKPEALASGARIKLHGSQINDCGLQGNNFKGVAYGPGNENAVVPGDWVPDPGTQAGPVRQDLGGIGGCDATDALDGCVLMLPICNKSNGESLSSGGGAARLTCPLMGMFRIYQTGANSHSGVLIQETLILSEGQGGDLPAGMNEARVIRLVD